MEASIPAAKFAAIAACLRRIATGVAAATIAFSAVAYDSPQAANAAAKAPNKATSTKRSTGSGKGSRKPDSASQKGERRKLFMWKVSGGPGEQLFILGSIHLVKEDFYPLPKEIDSAFDKSAILALEIDETKTNPLELNRVMMERGTYPADDNLMNHITAKTKEALENYLSASGAPPGAFNQMKPWVVSLLLPLSELVKQGFKPSLGVDKHFAAAALESGKDITELESMQFQLELLSGFGDELQDKLLLSSLLEMKDLKTEFARLLRAWNNGDEKEMLDIVTEDERSFPELKPVTEKLIYERNVTMTEKIDKYLKSQRPYFVVVGAGHLVGDRGILQLLRNKGYKVEQSTGVPAAVKSAEAASASGGK